MKKGWRKITRASGLIEEVCPHGVGHPQADSIRRMDLIGPPGNRGTWGVHGCDGCCFTDNAAKEAARA